MINGPMLIKTTDGKIHEGRESLHCLLMINQGIDPDDIVDTGIVTKGRVIWLGRKPD